MICVCFVVVIPTELLVVQTKIGVIHSIIISGKLQSDSHHSLTQGSAKGSKALAPTSTHTHEGCVSSHTLQNVAAKLR